MALSAIGAWIGGLRVFANHTRKNKHKTDAPMIFASRAAFNVCLSSRSGHSRCRWHTHLMNHGYFDFRKNPKTPPPIWAPCRDKNCAGHGFWDLGPGIPVEKNTNMNKSLILGFSWLQYCASSQEGHLATLLILSCLLNCDGVEIVTCYVTVRSYGCVIMLLIKLSTCHLVHQYHLMQNKKLKFLLIH